MGMQRFVNYAHRGASEYYPENTFLSFYAGVAMGANGIETDVQMSRDGVPVLFHDKTLERVTGEDGSIGDYTFEELQRFRVRKGEYYDRIVSLEDFLQHFGFRKLTFAIELKGEGTEQAVADLIRKYDMTKRVVVTSFSIDYIRRIKAYMPELEIGLLTREVTPEVLAELKAIDAAELCPKAVLTTSERVAVWHREGFRVRAWGVRTIELMKQAYDSGVDGMTVNFPDQLREYMNKK